MAKREELPIVMDFETEAIEDRPRYPPKPVGLSLQLPAWKTPKYYAFGHPTANNCSEADAKRFLAAAYKESRDGNIPIVCHNEKFDLDVAETHWGLEIPSWELLHDTMFLLFLDNPHSPDLKLKPSSERILGLPPDEQDALRDWCVEHKLIPRNKKEYGKFICKTPGDICGRYANGDVLRTRKLFRKLLPSVLERGMGAAYDRERQLFPMLLRSEREGIRVDADLLARDVELYDRALGNEERGIDGMVDRWLRRRLKAPGLNVDSDEDLADALVACGAADEALFLTTPGGGRSVSKKSLPLAVTDHKVLHALQYRSMLQTRLGTFLRPWHEEAQASKGRVHAHWNQVRQFGAGAKTGRISASRFMNAPVGVGTSQHDDTAMLAYRHPDFIKDLPQLPQVRIYLLPDEGQVWCKRDFAQQELRILAHFEDGVLLKEYQANPKLDMHAYAVKLMKDQHGVEVSRTRMKTIGFSLLYGMGAGELAQRLMLDVDSTKSLKKAYLSIFAGLGELEDSLKQRARAGEPFRTWGGRQYFCEEPKWSNKYNRMQTFDYKMLNYLIQGSAADCTKQALVNYSQVRKHGKFLVTVHDEINISVAPGRVKAEMKILNDAMADVALDCAMLSDGKTGVNWAELKKFEE